MSFFLNSLQNYYIFFNYASKKCKITIFRYCACQKKAVLLQRF